MTQVRLLLALVLVAACGEPVTNFAAICPSTCYSGPSGTEDVGECRAGVPVCDEDGVVLTCDGEVLPAEESTDCDALDSDCDGEVDQIPPRHWRDDDNGCLQEGVCRRTSERCDPWTGDWFCDYSRGPSEEVCDGRKQDEDCDGEVDEIDEIVLCYTGPPGTTTTGECRPGVETCDTLTGLLTCSDVTPRPETCDGLDNDCNGVTDDAPREYGGVAIVFGVDVSSSMGPYIDAVREAVCGYAESSPSVMFGLALIARPDTSWSLAQDIGTAGDLCESLGDIGDLNGGTERQLSVGRAVASVENPLDLTWPTDYQRLFIGFSDEPVRDIGSAATDCAETETTIHWFVDSEVGGYDLQVDPCGGATYSLRNNADRMLNDLSEIIAETCVDDEGE